MLRYGLANCPIPRCAPSALAPCAACVCLAGISAAKRHMRTIRRLQAPDCRRCRRYANRGMEIQPQGRNSSVRIKPRLTVTSNDAAIEAVSHHAGITRLISYQSCAAAGQRTTENRAGGIRAATTADSRHPSRKVVLGQGAQLHRLHRRLVKTGRGTGLNLFADWPANQSRRAGKAGR